jgi:YHS domain-containing protein
MASTKDRVCGMTVDTEKAAAQTNYKGRTYYFCSQACEQRFEAQPERYAPFAEEPLADRAPAVEDPNDLPRTKAGGMPAPKFGSAGSGGAEFERIHEDRDAR